MSSDTHSYNVQFGYTHLHLHRVTVSVTTCLENLEMSGNLTAVSEMSGILLKVRGKILSRKSGLKLFNDSCIFACFKNNLESLLC